MRAHAVNHAIGIAFVFALSASATLHAQKRFSFKTGESSAESRVIAENNRLVLYYAVTELSINETEADGNSYYKISIPGHSSSTAAGKPLLPLFGRVIAVPAGSEYTVSIEDVRSTRLKPASKGFRGRLYPAQESLSKNLQRDAVRFKIDSQTYASKEFVGEDTVRIEEIGTVRNQRLATLYISPVRYNPSTGVIETITAMKVTVTFSKSLHQAPGDLQPVSFEEQLNKGLLNYSPADVVPGFSDQPVKMIILTDSSFRKHLDPLIKWKTQKGFRVKTLYRGNGLAGNTYTQLRDTLTRIYKAGTPSDPAPEYLLIVGDINRIPYYGSGNVTDLYYGEYDGNGDFIPEVYTGRLPVADTNELKIVVNKIIQYEKFEFADTNKFYTNALSFAGEEPAYANTMNGQIKYAVSNYLTKANRINEYHFYYPHNTIPGTRDSVLKLIDRGLSFVNYTGHGDATGILHINIKIAEVAAMKNRNMYPFFISNACRTAQYNLAASFGNKMLTSDSKGAIGYIGCSNDSYWDEDYYWAVGVGTISPDPTYFNTGLGALDRLFHTHNEKASDWYYTMGQVNFAGNLSVSASASKWKKYYWETYTLLGDPSMIPITGTPLKFNVTLPDTLPNGIKSYTLSVDPFAYVAISRNDTLWDASYASPSGSVQLDLPGVSNSYCTVVITGQNRYPVIKKILFRSVKGEYLNLSGTIVNDAAGNNNGKADFGESFFLGLRVSNLGLGQSENLYAKIRTNSEWAVVKKDSAYIGTLTAGAERLISDKLEIQVASDVPDLGFIPVSLTLKDLKTEKKYTIDIPVHAPELRILNCTIDDRLTGNGDLVADPGESFYLVFNISNTGTSNTSGQFNLSSMIPGLSILEPSVKSGELKFGEITQLRSLVSLSGGIQSGGVFSVTAFLNCGPHQLTREFDFRAGKIRESFESLQFNVFPWFNGSPVPWIITDKLSYEGSFSARSGAISDKATTSLSIRTVYEKADSLRFYYRVSSEPNYDYFAFKLNGKEMLRKSGEIGWTRQAVAIPAGDNILEWSYKKDNSLFEGSDCAWIDLIDFAGTSTVRYIQKDIQLTRLVSPESKEKYGKEIISVWVRNKSYNAVNGFTLAYSVNNDVPVKQKFENSIPFNDSINVTFTSKADFSKYGKYNILVYGTENGDEYLLNDTLKAQIENTRIDEVFSVFPNPFTNEFTLFINSPANDEISLSLTNATGLVVYNKKKSLLPGVNSVSINDFLIAPGTYYLTVKGNTVNRTIPVIKLR